MSTPPPPATPPPGPAGPPPVTTGMPEWARQMTERYYSRTIAVFVLSGNVRDLVPLVRGGGVEYVTLQRYLNEEMFARRDLRLGYDRGGGVSFDTPMAQADFKSALTGYDSFHGTNFAAGLPRNSDGVLSILDNYLRLRLLDGRKVSLVVDFAETIAPAGEVSGLSVEDRNVQVLLKRWASNPLFHKADITICLITENLVELNPGITHAPGVGIIRIPLPDEAERRAFIVQQLGRTPLPEGSDVTTDTLAVLTAGLKLVQLQSLISHAVENRQPLTLKFLTRRKKDLIEAESAGLLEFVQSRFDLSMVAGLEAAKRKLKDAAQAIKSGRTDVLPMGYVICGPVGTGKTFLTTCFSGEVGIPAVTLKNFRSMWQGETEGNLERVLSLLKAMSPIAVVVDEADAQLGDRSSSGDSGVGNRVFAQIAQFMGNTEHRGKVIWFLLTCRPDLLPVDLKRQGRAEEHIALFYPDTDEERMALLVAMQKKTGTAITAPDAALRFVRKAGSLSGADIEAILIRARMKSALEGEAQIDESDLDAALDDFIPPSYPTEIELQNLVAVLECTSKSLLPERYRNMDRAEIIRRTRELSALIRE